MKYKIGDKVKLANNSEVNQEWRSTNVTITDVYKSICDSSECGHYLIKEDGGVRLWGDNDIEGLVLSDEEVSHPTHYQGAIEPIELIEAQGLSFSRGNVVKYVCRAGRKGSELEDLRKAEFYLKREIDCLERGKVND
ncbi:DUF3310 domain-containing protein [Dielma fastidiosa]|uniref:DUF3310 domain-containing protein n=1 Tax=Dielma fastidiosa TaxID=1034346 RepID=UPI000E473BD4|nr:DUF3310 domain-containing protein [Dielma fastidiosa]RHM97159.1 DUF3310 domain-containing protein [Dielma fastidiosa]